MATQNLSTLTCLSGDLAHTMLKNPQFLNDWRILYDRCKNATVLQDQSFVRTWYETYRDLWQPVIVYCRNSDGNFDGLWLLAFNPISKTLAHAGTNQAEYHTWLTLPGMDIKFLTDAWNELKLRFNFTQLHFHYLPSLSLIETLKSIPGIYSRCFVQKVNRCLLKIDENIVYAMFSKSSNKSRINRLKKLGKVEFRQISDINQIEQIFEEIISFYDFRQGAINNILPFQKDLNKRRFHYNLFTAAADKLIFTVTYLNNRPIAGFWGQVSGTTVHLGMVMHSPFLSRLSPGKIHLMQLCEYLQKKGIDLIDMTPGGDSWKSRYANANDEVALVTLYRSSFRQKLALILNMFIQLSKHSLTKIGIRPSWLRITFKNNLDNLNPSHIFRILKSKVHSNKEFRMYAYTGQNTFVDDDCLDKRIQCNSLNDLVAFKSTDSCLTTGAFLSNANDLFEKGAKSYSLCINNSLEMCGWMLVDQTEILLGEVLHPITLPKGSVILFNFYSQANFFYTENNQAIINHMVRDAFALEGTKMVYIFVRAKNHFLQKTVESMDFQYQSSYN